MANGADSTTTTTTTEAPPEDTTTTTTVDEGETKANKDLETAETELDEQIREARNEGFEAGLAQAKAAAENGETAGNESGADETTESGDERLQEANAEDRLDAARADAVANTQAGTAQQP